MILDIIPKASVDGGNDLVTCGQNPVALSGSTASDYQTLFWTTSGLGSFDDPTILHPVYTPGTSDIITGSVFLTLHATSEEPCNQDSDMVLLIIRRAASANAGPDSSICQDQSFTLSSAIAHDYSTITWSSNGDGTFDDPNTINPVYTPGKGDLLQGKSLLSITAEGVDPCGPAKDSMILTINRKPEAHPGPDGVICVGMTFNVEGVTASNFSSFTWEHTGQGTLTGTNTLSPVYTPVAGDTGTVILTLKVFGMSSCRDSMALCHMNVSIYSAVLVNAGGDQTINADTSATLHAFANGGSGNYRFVWEPSSLVQNDTAATPQTVILKKDTVFIVTATDKVTGCSASDTVRINIRVNPGEASDDCIVIYNVITPNGDGVNDSWVIDCIDMFPDNNVKIFNRWGALVNSFDHYDNTTTVWKGTNDKGKLLPDGTYYYILKIRNGRTFTGWVFLRSGS